MNKVILIGRIATDVEARRTESTTIARYRIAVDRRFRHGDQTTDFLNCVCFGKGAEFADTYLSKGMRIAVTGRIQTGSYTNKDGVKVNTFDIVVEDHEFVDSRQVEKKEEPKPDFMDLPEDMDDLPFN